MYRVLYWLSKEAVRREASYSTPPPCERTTQDGSPCTLDPAWVVTWVDNPSGLPRSGKDKTAFACHPHLSVTLSAITETHTGPLVVTRFEEEKVPDDELLARFRGLFQRRWRCGVHDSGYHNGVHCTPGDPHDGWGCGYRWTAGPLTDDHARTLGMCHEGDTTS